MSRRRLLSRIRHRRLTTEKGAVLVIVAGCLGLFIAVGAYAIDLGSARQAQQQAQTAADAAALAGAQDAATNASPATVTSSAQAMATADDPSADPAVVSTLANGSIRVTVSGNASSTFGGATGLARARVSATATAAYTSGSAGRCPTAGNGCLAVFAASGCSGPTTSVVFGGGVHVIGGTWSNGSINLAAGGSSFGLVTYGSGCSLFQGANTFTPSSGNPAAAAPSPSWPVTYADDFPSCSGASCTGPCDNGGSSCGSSAHTPSFCTQATDTPTWLLLGSYPYTLVSGQLYCAVGNGQANQPATWTGALQVNGNTSTTYESSFIGGSISVGGGTYLEACGYALSGYSASACNTSVPTPSTGNYPLFYAVSGAMTSLAGGLTGDVYAPNGAITIGGGTDSSGFMEGQTVNWAAGGITGDGPVYSGSGLTTSAIGESLTG